MKKYKIAVAGTGYVGLSLSVLLAQHNQVMAVDIVQTKVDVINHCKSPIQDDYIEKYLAERKLNLTATLDAKAAYSDADFVVIAAPGSWNITRMPLWSSNLRFLLATPHLCVRSSTARTSSLAQNFCANPRLCTIICIRAASSLALT